MLPVILTKKQKVLIIGAGRACEIKLKVLSNHPCNITVAASEFLCDLDENIIKINKNFEELDESFFQEFDLIYIGIPLNDTTMVEKLVKTKMVNVLSNPRLSNFIHPCTREDDDVMVSVANLNKPNPKKACALANEFIEYKKSK
ncbi:MAG: NAD(P)-dependent oxidoreductase [Campylobacterota bacterium]|nr:NAD(P)-dependent oxidoreductase [Campylobacterota bacterium]